ncbi:hypothetical protein OSH39_25175, partial [Mycobacterium ulcerans]|nr:hypothetical protein [Mycobacterium ulcerans]MEB3911367.1 hypothetical protein [Mycobacterium ulcerans]MEB3921605.1 hypothetical protein [Mycobacterium ulcerans]MEB3925741.1 hypothetical protein [Mycobacterium ulcerans]MEB3929868.1 hypothetical protein [Mycobacterium ulcerans]
MTDRNDASVPSLDLAVTYLRVSTKKQLYTAIDIDPDGNSITTQREVRDCRGKGVSGLIGPGVSGPERSHDD